MNARDFTHVSATADVEAPTRQSDASMVWSDARLLGFTLMDDVHEEFYEVVLRLVTCTDAHALAAIEEFEKHAISHFNQEDEWMRATNFPPRDCHVEEHAAVLKSVCEVKAALDAGQINAGVVRDFGMHLFGWFPGHADYLDSALAAWMTKQTMGGKPVVLRRTLYASRRVRPNQPGLPDKAPEND
ncbi:bacteriohemerythrin [Paraburkholderia tagetis]|uniref:Hemerythrin n=1 Tax=Paraburkholderia tagetis TaxID=2913261 RepID=A0A9X1RNT8_9BURK|nr:hemerythrin [Paraburkholderia tagetis]MCG5074848.1 hemerythrin [Paraburkholderia tagetis]